MITTYPRYRAWDKKHAHMYHNAYPFEHLVYVEIDPTDPEFGPPNGRMLQVNEKWFYWILSTEVELMPYLPFSDKTGKTICEGDIVATGLAANYCRSIVRIGLASTEGYESGSSEYCYPVDYYGVYLDGTLGLEDELLQNRMYVLGNVWENPELTHEQ